MMPGHHRITPLGFEQLSVTNTAKGLASIPSPQSSAEVKYALITVDTNPCRFRDDGTAPTASEGIEIVTGIRPLWYAGPVSKLQFIATASTSVINVSYYG